jgi:hypothetical protein
VAIVGEESVQTPIAQSEEAESVQTPIAQSIVLESVQTSIAQSSVPESVQTGGVLSYAVSVAETRDAQARLIQNFERKRDARLERRKNKAMICVYILKVTS